MGPPPVGLAPRRSVKREVSFFSDGLKLSGVLVTPDMPDGDVLLPGVVICHGFSQHKEIFGLSYAEALSRHGFACLTFDYRGFGGSEGQRGRLIPLLEVTDTWNALTFLGAQPEVDATRLGALGTSFGGSVVLHAAAADDRIRAAVCFDAIGSGRRWLRGLRRHGEWVEFLERLDKERVNRVLTGASEYVEYNVINPYVDHPGLKAAHEDRRRRFPDWQEELTLETALAVIQFAPEELAHLISPRALMVIYDNNIRAFATEEARNIYIRAEEPKSLVAIPASSQQYGHYFGEELEHWISLSADWFHKHLNVSGT